MQAQQREEILDAFNEGYARGKEKGLFEAGIAYLHIDDKAWSMDLNRGVCACSACIAFKEAIAVARAVLMDARRNHSNEGGTV